MRLTAFILSLSLLGMCSCSSDGSHDVVAVNSVMPVLSIPDKPKMDLLTTVELVEYAGLSAGLRAKLEGNNEKLKEYSMEMKAALTTYDDFAKTHNANSSTQMQVISSTVKGKSK